MENLKILGMYVAIAAVLAVVFGGKEWLGRLVGDRTLGEKVRRENEQFAVDLIANVGTGKAAHQGPGRTTYRTSWGLRLVGPALACLVLYKLLEAETLGVMSDAFALNGEIDLTLLLNPEPWMAVCLLLILWYSLYLWGYEIDIDGHTLTHTGWRMNRKRFDLRQLESVQETRNGLYVLRFKDGRRTEVLKYVTGAKDLTNRLKSIADTGG